jgi:hypothetical protein
VTKILGGDSHTIFFYCYETTNSLSPHIDQIYHPPLHLFLWVDDRRDVAHVRHFFSQLSTQSTLKRVCMQAGLVWFSSWKGVCVTAMATAGSRRGLGSFFFHGFGHLCFSLTLPSSPTFKGGVCSWVYWVFL